MRPAGCWATGQKVFMGWNGARARELVRVVGPCRGLAQPLRQGTAAGLMQLSKPNCHQRVTGTCFLLAKQNRICSPVLVPPVSESESAAATVSSWSVGVVPRCVKAAD